MSSLSGGIKEGYSSYIKFILYQAQFGENSLNIKNIFPYGISIQFDNDQEKYIEPIKNINEIFDPCQNEFKFYINNTNQKHLIKINCFTKSIFVINKKFASVKIAIYSNNNNIKNNNKEKKKKKWYYLKNKNGELIIKLLLSIDIINISNIVNNRDNDNINKRYFQNENEFDNNIFINKPNNFNIHFNSISNNNLNGIQSSTFMSTSHYISSSNNSLKSSSTKTNNSNISIPVVISNSNNNIINNRQLTNNNMNLLSSIIEKDDSMTINESENNEKFGELNSNNLFSIIQNLHKKNNQKLFIKSKNLIQKKQNLSKEENKYFKNRKNLDEDKTKFKNNIKSLDKKRQIYENKYLDLTENINKYEKNLYKLNIEKDLNKFENDMLSNFNDICLNHRNLDEIILEEKMTKNYFGQYSILVKNFRDNEKSVINNYYNNKGYSFESNNYKNSLYLYGNGGNSNKVLFNIMLDNRSIYNNYNYNSSNFNIKPSPISFKFKEINKELSVSISNSNSNASSPKKKNNKQKSLNNNDDINQKSKRRLITDYSKSTFNIIDDLYIFDEIPDINKNKASKSNIINNNLALKIDDISNVNNNVKTNLKHDNNSKKNKNIIQKNNLINKRNYNYNLVATGKKKRKKITINDVESNLYYNLDEKYYAVTTTNNKIKNKEISNLNKKIIPKKIENINTEKEKKDSDTEKCLNTGGNFFATKNYYKSIIFKQKADNNININQNNSKNIIQQKKCENNNNIIQDNNNTINGNNKKNNNRVFKNIFTNNKKKDKDKDKEKIKRKKVSSIITETNTNKSFNNSILGINSLLPEKYNSLGGDSRNSKFIQFNTNPNKNIKFKKMNKNCIQLRKKNDININNKFNLINYFCYISNETKNKTNRLNKKISFYLNKKKTDSNVSKSINIKNINSNTNTKNKSNNIDNITTNRKITNNNTNKTLNQNKKSNCKKISKIESKISFYIKKKKAVNEYDNKTFNAKKNNNSNKLTINKNKNININEYSTNTAKNKNNQNKLQKNKYNYCCIANNSHLKPLINSNKNKKSYLSLINSSCN